MIEVSNGKSKSTSTDNDDDMVEVVKDNDNELGECEIEYERSVNWSVSVWLSKDWDAPILLRFDQMSAWLRWRGSDGYWYSLQLLHT